MAVARLWISLAWAVLLFVYSDTVDSYIGSTWRWVLIASAVFGSGFGFAVESTLKEAGITGTTSKATTDDDAGEGDDAPAEEPKPEG